MVAELAKVQQPQLRMVAELAEANDLRSTHPSLR